MSTLPPESRPPVVTDAPLDEQAAAWWLREREGLSPRERSALREWLNDPEHACAFARMGDTWKGLDDLSSEGIDALRPADSHRSYVGRRSAQRSSGIPRRRVAMIAGSVLSIALMALAGTVFWQQNNAPTYTAKIDTVRGQVREVDLPDGSHLVLDTDTHIEVSLFAHHRDVRLSHGQVMFVVEHDASRPFQVDAGGTRVTVLGTRFSVRYTESGLQDAGVGVAVEQGHVRVQNLATVDLLAQQAVNVDGRGEPGPVHALPPGAVAPWRQSHVNFNDTPLAAALAEFERYGPTDLALGDGRASRLRITGSFDVRQPEVFAHALPHVLAVRLSKRGDTTVIESSR